MSKFSDIADLLADSAGPLGADGPVAMEAAFRPMERPPHEWFEAVHDPEYYRGFLEGTLDEKAKRRYHIVRQDEHLSASTARREGFHPWKITAESVSVGPVLAYESISVPNFARAVACFFFRASTNASSGGERPPL